MGLELLNKCILYIYSIIPNPLNNFLYIFNNSIFND